MEEQLSTWIEVARSPQRRKCQEYALVLQAMGIPHGIAEHAGVFVVVVRSQESQSAREQIERYDRENQNWPPREAAPVAISDGVQAAISYAGVLVLMFVLAQRQSFGLEWWEEGRAHAARIRHGALWRCMTALTLHLDASHLASNIVFGALFGVVLAQSIGSGWAWIGFVVSGALGNLANAWIQSENHMSVGASTAVFGALGIQVAYEWMRRRELRYTRLRRWAPLVMGAALLGMLGTGGGLHGETDTLLERMRETQRVIEKTDVMAHVTGFVVGLAIGVALAWSRLPMRTSSKVQALLGWGAVISIALAWMIAFAR